jgi:hypothetical protein
MKPIYVVVLLAAGALGGAVLMKVVRDAGHSTPAPVAEAPAPATTPEPVAAPPVETPAAAAPEPVAPAAPVEAKKPSPVRRETPSQVAAAREPVAPPPAPVQPAPAEPVTQRPNPEPVAAAPVQAAPPAPVAPPEPRQVTLTAGTLIPIRLIDGVSSQRNAAGDTFTASLDKPLVADGLVIAERGARAEGRVVTSDQGGKVKGVAGISIELTRIHTSDGQVIAVRTDPFQKQAEQSQGKDAAKVGGGAALGAIIGAIAGGGKGAAIGAAAGGGAGAGAVLLTRGQPATLPSETRISFRLSAPVTVVEKR